jgi:hypothetical protein
MPTTDLTHLVKAIGMCRERMVYGLEKTPDDRLDWVPAGEARSPLGIAGAASRFLFFLTYLVETKSFPERPSDPPPPPASREAAVAALNEGFAGLERAVAALTDADMTQLVPSPWGEQVPLAEMSWWMPMVLGYLQGQFNYIQTAYGDGDPNMPPEWYARAQPAGE